MPAPICMACGLSMRCHRNDQPVLVCADESKQEPYQLYYTDTYRCDGCGSKVAVGFSKAIERDEENFASELERVGDDVVRAF